MLDEDMTLAQLLAKLKEDSKYLIEITGFVARMNRSYYEALLFQGFSEEQALEMVLAQGLDVTGRSGYWTR